MKLSIDKFIDFITSRYGRLSSFFIQTFTSAFLACLLFGAGFVFT
ncbi:hypothetical protein VP199E371_P0076 [Vibrio phage 199E37-1]|nr:hypothetical protein VP199E371_P0076 [Vibrio phage 199E37-1]